jgi:hypothetical protein
MDCRDVREHLDTCAACRVDLAAKGALRDGVRGAFLGARDLDPTAEFLTRLRTELATTVRQALPLRRSFRFPGWWALAATVLVTVAGVLAYGGRDWIVTAGALARAAAGDHRNCALQRRLAESSIPLEEAVRRYGVATYHVLEKLPPDDIETTAGPARIVRRHACVYEGRRFAHVVLAYRGTFVSLLVTADDRGLPIAFPGEALPHVTAARQVDHMSVVSFRTSRYAVFFAGEVAPADLTALADAVAGPLYRELAGA